MHEHQIYNNIISKPQNYGQLDENLGAFLENIIK